MSSTRYQKTPVPAAKFEVYFGPRNIVITV